MPQGVHYCTSDKKEFRFILFAFARRSHKAGYLSYGIYKTLSVKHTHPLVWMNVSPRSDHRQTRVLLVGINALCLHKLGFETPRCETVASIILGRFHTVALCKNVRRGVACVLRWTVGLHIGRIRHNIWFLVSVSVQHPWRIGRKGPQAYWL